MAAVVAKHTSMSSSRRTIIHRERHNATDWLAMMVCVAHPVSRTGVGYGDMCSRHLKWMSPSPTIVNKHNLSSMFHEIYLQGFIQPC